MTIRPITALDEFEKCVELQRAAWGLADIDIMPKRMFVTDTRIGGLVLGAFDGDRLLGFASATPGVRDGKPYWYSQMLAVDRDHRDQGLGADLKLAQRDHARQSGIDRIEWTFDPLESKNAYLNITKLGIIVRRYYVNLYGAASSQLWQGLESDRLIAEWWIDRPRLTIQGDVRRVYIPADIQALKKQSLQSARDVQLRVREQFLQNFADDYVVAGFERRDECSEYLFIQGASRVYRKD
jgi:predicted GNAT superfamily acetyltransferase